MRTKVKAFTIHEMLVVLALSSVVIAMALLMLHLIQKQMSVAQFEFQKSDEVRWFKRLLVYDFNRCQMFYDAKENHLIGVSETDSIRYKIFSNYVLRNTDTLFVKVQDKDLYLDQQIVFLGTIDAVRFEIEKDKIFVYKTKGASHYMRELWLSR